MYNPLILAHSWLRWALVFTLLYTFIKALLGWLANKGFHQQDQKIAKLTVTIAHLQLLIGLALYIFSPLMQSFFNDMGAAMKVKEIRFFGVEHAFLNIIAIVLLTIGNAKAKRAVGEFQKSKHIAIWFGVALLLIWMAIPWALSPMAPLRDWFRF